MMQRLQFFCTLLAVFHQEDFHEVVQVAVEHALGIGSLVACTQVLHCICFLALQNLLGIFPSDDS